MQAAPSTHRNNCIVPSRSGFLEDRRVVPCSFESTDQGVGRDSTLDRYYFRGLLLKSYLNVSDSWNLQERGLDALGSADRSGHSLHVKRDLLFVRGDRPRFLGRCYPCKQAEHLLRKQGEQNYDRSNDPEHGLVK